MLHVLTTEKHYHVTRVNKREAVPFARVSKREVVPCYTCSQEVGCRARSEPAGTR